MEDLDALLAGGAQIVSVVPDNSVVVASSSVVPVGAGIRTVTRIDASDKISPDLGTASPFTVIVEFHPDVTTDSQNAVALAEGITLQHPALLIASHAIAVGSLSDLQALAAHDEVSYIFPADPALLTENNINACAGMLTLSGPVAQFANLVHGWDMDSDNVAHLAYVFQTLTTKQSASLVRSEIVRALNAWAQVTNVAFNQGTNAAAPRTIAIEFASGAHGDSYPFEGPGGSLAHTFYPVPVNPESIAGDMHLNADENWNVGGDIDIYSVALHEAGHAIGLGHSDKPGDVMYPYYRRGMSLSANDIGAAQALYGVPNAAAAVTAAPVSLAAPVAPSAPVAAPVHLTLDSSPGSVQNAQFSSTGVVSGGTAPFSVQWLTDKGYSGAAKFTNSTSWTASAITLATGSNTITFTVFDSADKSATSTVTVTLTAAAQTTTSVTSNSGATASGPVAISISAPSASLVTTSAATMSLTGIATGGAGIVKITWQTSNGCTGTATGTSHWTVPSIPLLVGTNTVVVRAYDANGANAWAAAVAVRN